LIAKFIIAQCLNVLPPFPRLAPHN